MAKEIEQEITSEQITPQPSEQAQGEMEQNAEAPVAKTPEETPAPTAKDTYRARIKEDYPELDMEDEEAYYGAANERYDDYKKMRSGLENINKLVDKSPAFRDMVQAAKEGGENFNPFAWAAKERGLDLQALAEDPEYADIFAESHAAHLKKEADGERIKKEASDNYQASIAEINSWASENGISEEQKQQTLQKVYDMLNDANVGKIPLDVFQLLCKGATRDADVAKANEEGKQEGLAANVTDKLRKMPKPEKQTGRQMAEQQPQPTPKSRNPFMA